MRAVVLVGGEGTRLRPLTLTTPKQMLPIVGVAMIERVLGQLAGHGIDEAVLSLGYLPDAFTDAYPDGVAAGVALSYAVEPEPLDTAGAIRFAAEHAGMDETFVVVNGDVLTDLNLSALVQYHRDRGAEGTIALHPVADPSAFGVVPTDADGRVVAFVEKPRREEAPTNLINAGTYVLEPSVLARVPFGRRVSIERETFPAMVEDGRLYAMADDSYWLDAGTLSAYLQAHRDLLQGRRGGVPCPRARSVAEGVWVSGSADLAGTVKGATWVGDGVSIAEGATVEASSLGAGCIVEARATVTGSVLLPGARVASDASVSGSVLGPGSTVGERCDLRPLSVLGAGVVVPSGTMLDGKRVPE
ncbi:MAG TPA: NDP-sugar synthase [Acidimicrobiales bacterium]|nr:NDP-sugar synthase [Acidimicrobiales bacterium]